MSALIIDTSTDAIHLGLCEQGTLLAWTTYPHNNQLSKFLLTSILALLQEQGLTLRDLVYIAVGIGPGSFTGTRIGAIVCKSLSFSLDIPHVGFSSTLLKENKELLIAEIQERFEKKAYDLEISYCSLTPNSSRIKAPELN